jgi:ubiquinol-cytochrome c reductase cytochrome b subunit
VKSPQDTLPFHPYYTVKDAFYLSCFCILFAALVFYAPNLLVSPDNATPANPLVTPAEIVPEWYLLPFYAILRSIPDKLTGVVALFGAIATLCFLPWLDTSKVRSCRFRPTMKWFFWFLLADCILLGYVGSQPVDGAFHGIPLLWVGRLGALWYFAHFWVITPIVGLVETPKPLPDSIAKTVLGAAAAE